jgi:hypothetical protein
MCPFGVVFRRSGTDRCVCSTKGFWLIQGWVIDALSISHFIKNDYRKRVHACPEFLFRSSLLGFVGRLTTKVKLALNLKPKSSRNPRVREKSKTRWYTVASCVMTSTYSLKFVGNPPLQLVTPTVTLTSNGSSPDIHQRSPVGPSVRV